MAEHALISVYDEDDGPWLGFACLCGWAGENGTSREQVEAHMSRTRERADRIEAGR